MGERSSKGVIYRVIMGIFKVLFGDRERKRKKER